MMKKNSVKVSLKKYIQRLVASGFFDVFGATIINSVVSFVYGIFLVRVMSKHDYGMFSYIQNITNFGFLFCSLGVNLGLLQYCSDDIDDDLQYSYGQFALKIGSICSIIMGLIMILYTFIDNSGFANLTGYIVEASFLPVLYFAKEWITSNLRWQLKNREYGIVMNIHTVTNAVFAVVGAYLGAIRGVILGIYLAYLCAVLIGGYYLRGSFLTSVKKADLLNKQKLWPFMKYSITMCIVNALISVLFTIDTFVIGNIMQNEEAIAMYKAASVIPFALNMIPNSIMTFVYPHVAKNRENRKWLQKNVVLLYASNGIINLFIGIVLYVLAPFVIAVIFGNRYEGILPVFRILILSYIVSACFRTPAANLFGILRKTKTALMVSCGTVVLSVTMSILLVGKYGIVGASVGSVCTFGAVGIISTGILFYYIFFRKSMKFVK